MYAGHGCPKCTEERILTNKKNRFITKQCEKCGYEWKIIKTNVIKKTGCPICTNRLVKKGYNDLETTHPDLLKEWDYEKNKHLLPNMITSSSTKKVWWLCEKKHSYQQKIADKVKRNFKCPICSNRILVSGINDLQTVFPEILKEWDYEKNVGINPSELSCKTTKKVWWKCKENHSWNASVYERVWHDRTGCPYCNGNILKPGKNDLQTINPVLAKEFHLAKNEPLTPKTITAHSGKKVWWVCPRGHEYESSVDKRVSGQNCPYCSNKKLLIGFNDLETNYPELAKEWHPTENGILTPKNIVFGSLKKVWWICSKCCNTFQARVVDRTRKGNGCPECAIKLRVQSRLSSLLKEKTLNDDKELIRDWDYEANYPKTPLDYTYRSGQSVYWKCHVCKYQWKAKILNKSRHNGCPACSNKVVVPGFNDLATTNPELSQEWHPTKNGILTPKKVTRGSGKKVWWLCPMGHEYQATLLARNGGFGVGCPKCYSRRQTSFAEQAVYHYIKKIFPDAINGFKASFLGKMELDIYIPSIRWAVEYDGMAWHNEKTKEREIRKYKACKENGIKLYRLKEDEIEKQYDGTYDSAMHTEDMWTSEKLNQTIYSLLLELCHGPFMINFPIDVEKDRFSIMENMKVKLDESIAVKYPLLVKEWDYEKNGTLKPENVSHGMQTKVWWKCSSCGISFQANISSRCSGTGCPKCARNRNIKARMKKVACISLKTNKIIKIYDSITEASKSLNMKSVSNITSVCKGNRPNAGGYFWKYVE